MSAPSRSSWKAPRPSSSSRPAKMLPSSPRSFFSSNRTTAKSSSPLPRRTLARRDRRRHPRTSLDRQIPPLPRIGSPQARDGAYSHAPARTGGRTMIQFQPSRMSSPRLLIRRTAPLSSIARIVWSRTRTHDAGPAKPESRAFCSTRHCLLALPHPHGHLLDHVRRV